MATRRVRAPPGRDPPRASRSAPRTASPKAHRATSRSARTSCSRCRPRAAGPGRSRATQDEIADASTSAPCDIRPAHPDSRSRNLSGGNQQKVLLARWLLTEPRLLILDEPTRGIDVGAKAEIQRLVARSSDDGMAVLFISAELEEVVRLAAGSWCCATAQGRRARQRQTTSTAGPRRIARPARGSRMTAASHRLLWPLLLLVAAAACQFCLTLGSSPSTSATATCTAAWSTSSSCGAPLMLLPSA